MDAVDQLQINIIDNNEQVIKNKLFFRAPNGYLYTDVIPNSNRGNIGIYLLSEGKSSLVFEFDDELMRLLMADEGKFDFKFFYIYGKVLNKLSKSHENIRMRIAIKCIAAHIISYYCK